MPLLLFGHAACRTRIHVSALLASPAPQPRKAEAVSTLPEAETRVSASVFHSGFIQW